MINKNHYTMSNVIFHCLPRCPLNPVWPRGNKWMALFIFAPYGSLDYPCNVMRNIEPTLCPKILSTLAWASVLVTTGAWQSLELPLSRRQTPVIYDDFPHWINRTRMDITPDELLIKRLPIEPLGRSRPSLVILHLVQFDRHVAYVALRKGTVLRKRLRLLTNFARPTPLPGRWRSRKAWWMILDRHKATTHKARRLHEPWYVRLSGSRIWPFINCTSTRGNKNTGYFVVLPVPQHPFLTSPSHSQCCRSTTKRLLRSQNVSFWPYSHALFFYALIPEMATYHF